MAPSGHGLPLSSRNSSKQIGVLSKRRPGKCAWLAEFDPDYYSLQQLKCSHLPKALHCQFASPERLPALANSRAIRRQRNRRLGLIPCRRATAEIFASGRSASATIARFSASPQRRRASATTVYRRVKSSPDIAPDLAPVVTNRHHKSCIQNAPQGGLHRRDTLF